MLYINSTTDRYAYLDETLNLIDEVFVVLRKATLSNDKVLLRAHPSIHVGADDVAFARKELLSFLKEVQSALELGPNDMLELPVMLQRNLQEKLIQDSDLLLQLHLIVAKLSQTMELDAEDFKAIDRVLNAMDHERTNLFHSLRISKR